MDASKSGSVPIGRTNGLDEIAEVDADMEGGHATGKLVVTPSRLPKEKTTATRACRRPGALPCPLNQGRRAGSSKCWCTWVSNAMWTPGTASAAVLIRRRRRNVPVCVTQVPVAML